MRTLYKQTAIQLTVSLNLFMHKNTDIFIRTNRWADKATERCLHVHDFLVIVPTACVSLGIATCGILKKDKCL